MVAAEVVAAEVVEVVAGDIVVTKTIKPVIRSFTYQVTPHQPLRPKTPGAGQQTSSQQGMDPAMMAGGGRRPRRSGGGGPGRGGPWRIVGLDGATGLDADHLHPPGRDMGQGWRRGL